MTSHDRPADPEQDLQALLDASKSEGTVADAPAWLGGVIAYGVHHPHATLHQWVKGQHINSYLPMIVALRGSENYDEAAALAQRLLAAVAPDTSFDAFPLVEQLVVIYAKQKRWADALEVCDKYPDERLAGHRERLQARVTPKPRKALRIPKYGPP